VPCGDWLGKEGKEIAIGVGANGSPKAPDRQTGMMHVRGSAVNLLFADMNVISSLNKKYKNFHSYIYLVGKGQQTE